MQTITSFTFQGPHFVITSDFTVVLLTYYMHAHTHTHLHTIDIYKAQL